MMIRKQNNLITDNGESFSGLDRRQTVIQTKILTLEFYEGGKKSLKLAEGLVHEV